MRDTDMATAAAFMLVSELSCITSRICIMMIMIIINGFIRAILAPEGLGHEFMVTVLASSFVFKKLFI